MEPDTCSDLLIVVATYNELENLPKLLDELMVLLPQATILVVDDNSPDGTPAWLAEQSAVRPQLRFLIREKKVGLGAAAAAGFAWGMQHGPAWLVTMDADFSHRPEDVCRVLARAVADDTIDLVIGSRYVAGGEIVGWPWRRRVASRWINRLTRWSLGLTTRDNSGALRVYRMDALRSIQADRLESTGYVYLQEVLLRLRRNNARMVEVPIRFVDRMRGESKISIREAFASVSRLLRWRWSGPRNG